MLNHIETIRRLHGTTWDYRQRPELNAVWPTPDRGNSLRFSVTEGAESLDEAHLRNGDYARNSEKRIELPQELADTAIMLCTALGPEFPEAPEHLKSFPCASMDRLMYEIAEASYVHNCLRLEVGTDILCTLDLTCALFREIGADAHTYVKDKLERTYRKFVKSPGEIIDAVVTLEINAPHLIDYETLQAEYGGSLMDVVNIIGVWDAIDFDVDAYKVVKVSMK